MQFNAQEMKRVLAMIVRYGFSGFSGIGVNLVIFSALVTYTDVWLLFASVSGFIGAYIVTFLMHKYWTFKNVSKELFYRQSVIYFFSAVATLLVNTSLLYVFVVFLGMHPITAQFVSLLIGGVLSFLFTTQVTFHQNASRVLSLTHFLNKSLWVRLWHKRVWFVSLFILMALCVFLRITFFPLTFTTDSESYTATAELLSGHEDAIVYGERILKPLAPYVVALIAQTGISTHMALLVQALVFYFALGFAVFWFGYELFRKPEHAFVLAVIVVTSYPIFRYGINYYTETGVWALYFATLALIVRWVRNPSFTILSLISAFLLLGLLWKEYTLLVGLIFGLAILFQNRFSWTQKIHAVIQTGFLVLIPWGMWQYVVFLHYDYSYLTWLAIGSSPTAYTNEYTLFKLTKTTFGLLLTLWPLVFLGMYRWHTISFETRKMLLLMAGPSFGFLLWGFVSSRLFFSVVPLLAPLVVVGFMSLPSTRIKLGVVLIVLILNSILITLVFDPSIRSLFNSIS